MEPRNPQCVEQLWIQGPLDVGACACVTQFRSVPHTLCTPLLMFPGRICQLDRLITEKSLGLWGVGRDNLATDRVGMASAIKYSVRRSGSLPAGWRRCSMPLRHRCYWESWMDHGVGIEPR